ncbi:helicase HerA-like domain-containing protein [Enterobacter hormaechei]
MPPSPTSARCCWLVCLTSTTCSPGTEHYLPHRRRSGATAARLQDLRAITQYIGDNAKSFQNQYGNISSASVGAIQRGLLTLEQQGAEHFGEPMLDIKDWMRTDSSGKGIINILSAEKLYQMPKLYAASLLWMLSELYEQLPEAGDLEKPKLVFFFDEAHLLFNDAPQVLLDKIEQVIRLIRSKGVGVWFVSQNPSDIPDNVLGSWVTACSTPCAPLRRRLESGESRGANHACQSGL